MIIDMYYYRKMLLNRYNRIKYYQRNREVKSVSVGFFTPLCNHVSDYMNDVKKLVFGSSENHEITSEDFIRKELNKHRVLPSQYQTLEDVRKEMNSKLDKAHKMQVLIDAYLQKDLDGCYTSQFSDKQINDLSNEINWPPRLNM